MAWEWSHTPEAYENARANLEEMDVDELRVMWAEWRAFVGPVSGASVSELDEERYERMLGDAQALGPARLVADIWNRMVTIRTCTNGGHAAHGCPFGCEPHLVSFSRV